jgi:peptide-methionine (S)-S-oxide reductase
VVLMQPERSVSPLLLAMALISFFGGSAKAAKPFPDPAIDTNVATAKGKQTAVLAGGCFWCTEAVFEQLDGVDKVVAGFAGGDAASANYEIVSAGRTNHAESIEITYDPARISYGTLLKIFFSIAHDPTQLNRQGPDYGRQYRSAIFYKNDEQKRIAEAYIKQLSQMQVFKKPIVTEVTPLQGFYSAGEDHQNFCSRHPNNPYVITNSLPKLDKLKKEDGALLKK